MNIKVVLLIVSFLGLTIQTFSQIPGKGVKDIDNNFYPTVIIGNQEWMAKNLRTTHFANGDPISYIEDNTQWDNCVNTNISAYCYVNGDSSKSADLGNFYNWYAATDKRNVCPTGWHLSTESDWNQLVKYVDGDADTISIQNGTIMSSIAGGKLKSTESGTWGPPNVGATNEFGFNSKGTNFRGAGGINYYWPLIRSTNYWVPKDSSITKAWVRTINNDAALVGINLIGGAPVDNKSMGNSIRCVSNYPIKCITNIIVYDTVLISVIDTLIINTNITGINLPNNQSSIKIFPNPAKTHITINYGNLYNTSGYRLRITNTSGQNIFSTEINQQTSYIDLSGWTGNGIYFVQLIDPKNNTIENRKIVIQ